MNGAIFRIDDSPMRSIISLLLGGFVAFGFLWIIFTGRELGAFRWLVWGGLFYLAFLLANIVRQWRGGAPFLVATREGLWLKDAESFGVIPWSDITAVGKVPLVKAIELRLADRRKYLARVSPLRVGLALNLLLFPKISLPLHFTGCNADEVARVLRDLWSEHR